MSIAYIALGCNVDDPEGHARENLLWRALGLMALLPVITMRKMSDFIETDPVGGPSGQPKYLNAVIEIQADIDPPGLLKLLGDVETGLGRDRANEQRWGRRTIDLDVLLFDDVVMDTPELTIPHPRMHQRRFVLGPLAQIAPDVMHPVLKKTAAVLLAELK